MNEGLYNWQALTDMGFTQKFFDTAMEEPFNLFTMGVENYQKAYLNKVLTKYGSKAFEEPAKITLTTLHGSKGREKKTVIICPDFTRTVTEAFRVDRKPETLLAYVGVTRAVDNLIMLVPQQVSSFPYPEIGKT